MHCHLDMIEDWDDKKIELVNKKTIALTNGTNPKNNRRALELGKNKNVKVCLGFYPIEIIKFSDEEIGEEIEFIRKNKNNIIGIGEIGLDHKESENKEEWDKQEKWFTKLVQLGIDLDKPVFIHSRKAEVECIEILEKLGAKRVMMHCFSGKLKLVDRILGNGWFVSIPGNVVFSEHFQKVIEKSDISQLFGETDSPYMHPKKEWPNYPWNVLASYEKIGEIKKMSLKDVEKKLEDNYKKLVE